MAVRILALDCPTLLIQMVLRRFSAVFSAIMGLVVSGAVAAAPLVEREEELRRAREEKRIKPPIVSYYKQGVYSPAKKKPQVTC